MEFYRQGLEHSCDDYLSDIQEKCFDIKTVGNADLLSNILANKPHDIGVIIVKPPKINTTHIVIDIVQNIYPDLELVFLNKTRFTRKTIIKMYPDLTADKTMTDLLDLFFSNLDSVLVVFKGTNASTQKKLNLLKKVHTLSGEQHGPIRKRIESVKYNQTVFELWKSRYFSEKSGVMLARCYLLSRGIHTPDSNEDTIQFLKSFLDHRREN